MLNFGFMFKNTINDKQTVVIEPADGRSILVNGERTEPDIIETRPGTYHVILKGVSTEAEVIAADAIEKVFHVRINGNTYKVAVADQYDQLLRSMGMDASSSKKAADLKAPMPGLVSEVSVTEGQEIKKGDKLLVLEAMKMENILKAPEDAIVKKVLVTKGKTVEKNEVLILFAS